MNVSPQFDIELDNIAGSASRLPSNLIRNAKNLLETLADNFPAQHKMLGLEVIKKAQAIVMRRKRMPGQMLSGAIRMIY